MNENLRCPCPERAALSYRARDRRYACTKSECIYGGESGCFPSVGEIPVLIAFRIVDTICDERRYVQSAAPRYVSRRSGAIHRFVSSMVFGVSKTTERNCRTFLDQVKAVRDRPAVLIIGSGTPGSGAAGLWQDDGITSVGIDIYPSATVDYIADAHHLPFADGTFDGVWIQAVLEHVLDPQTVVSEISRVLKRSGCVYAETPFMQQVHEGAYDFTRFTITGHRYLFRDFELLSMGPNKGPAISFAWSFKYLLWSIIRNKAIASALSLPVFFVCRFLDRLISTEAAWDGPAGVYFLGRKSESRARAREVAALYRGLQR